MRTSAIMRPRAAVGVGLAALALSACSASVSIGESGLSASKLADGVKEKLTENAGRAPDAVECDGKLGADTGDTQVCHIKDGDDVIRVDVTTTGTEEDKVLFSFDVEQYVDADGLAEAVSKDLAAQVGRPPEKLTCEGPLGSGEGDMPGEQVCQLEDGGVQRRVDVTATSGLGEDLTYNIQVAELPD